MRSQVWEARASTLFIWCWCRGPRHHRPSSQQLSKFCWRLLSGHWDLASGCLNTTKFKAAAASVILKRHSSWRKEMRSQANPVHHLGWCSAHGTDAQANGSHANTVPSSLASSTAAPSQPGTCPGSTSSSYWESTPAALKFVTSPLMSLINLLSR